MGGLLALLIYTRQKKISFGVIADSIAPGLAVAQAIGRWGNFINQELYGAPTNLPWAIFIDPAHRLPEYANQAYYHPLFLYESLWNLANAALLLWVARRFTDRLKNGDIFLIYLVVYPVGRFFLEFLRLDPSPIGTFNVNQTLMGVIAVSSLIALVFRHSKGSGVKGSPVADELTTRPFPAEASDEGGLSPDQGNQEAGDEELPSSSEARAIEGPEDEK